MKCPNHLCLQRAELAPSDEWAAGFPGWCFFRIEEGQGYWLGDNGAQELSAGQVAALSPLREGFFRSSQIAPVVLIYFRFSPELACGLFTPAECDCFEGLATQPAYAARFFNADSPGARLFANLTPTSGASTLLQRAELLRFVATLFAGELLKPAPADTMVLSVRQRLRLLVNQIPEAEFLKLTPDEMAARCGSSLTHFNRSFRKLFAVSPGRKQEQIRLRIARQRLAETTSRLETLAAEAGFRSVKEFSEAFKRQFGVSPAAWRHPRLRKIRARGNGQPAGPQTKGPKRDAAR